MSNITQITIGNAEFNAVIEDQRNIVEIIDEEPNTVIITVPGIATNSLRTNLTYGSGAPWTIEIEV